MTRRHPTGAYPADVAPDRSRPPARANDNADRFNNLAVTKATDDDKAHALAYLCRTNNLDLADVLGLPTII